MGTRIKTGDTVKIISGANKGTTGKVVKIVPADNKVYVTNFSVLDAELKLVMCIGENYKIS